MLFRPPSLPPQTPIEQQTHTLLTEINLMKRTMSALNERNQMLEEMVKALVTHQGVQLSSEFPLVPREYQERTPSRSFLQERTPTGSRDDVDQT